MFEFSPTDYQAMWLSLRVAIVATVLSLPLGFAAAYLLTYGRFRGKLLLDAVINLPLILPPVVVGYLLLLLLGGEGILGRYLAQWGIRVVFTWKGAVAASMVVGFPLMVRAIRIAMEAIDLRLIQASRTLGARWYDTLWSVILPLSGKGLLAGGSLMFARSLGEFGATIILAGNIPGLTQTIPLAIFDYANSPGGEAMALSLCVVSIVLAFSVLMISEVSLSRLFRRNGP